MFVIYIVAFLIFLTGLIINVYIREVTQLIPGEPIRSIQESDQRSLPPDDGEEETIIDEHFVIIDTPRSADDDENLSFSHGAGSSGAGQTEDAASFEHERNVSIDAPQAIYAGETFTLTVQLAETISDLSSVAAGDERLQLDQFSFISNESTPLVAVEIQGSADDYGIQRPKIVRQLVNPNETFRFLVQARRANQAPLTITVSYVKPTGRDRLIKKTVQRTIENAQEIKQVITEDYEPAGATHIELYSTDLAININTLWGLSKLQADTLSLVATPILVILALFLTLLYGGLDSDGLIQALFAGILAMLSSVGNSAIVDLLAKNFGN